MLYKLLVNLRSGVFMLQIDGFWWKILIWLSQKFCSICKLCTSSAAFTKISTATYLRQKFCSICSIWVEKGWEWNFKWRRHLFDRELEMANCFRNDVAGSCIQIHKKDEWIWKIDLTRQYSERLQTKTNLRRRRVAINDTLCPFCGNSEENEAHKPWQHFSQHAFCLPSRIRLNRWRSWWLALTWTVWQHRNKIIFSNQTFDGNKLMDDAIFTLWTWLKNFEKDFAFTYSYWSSNIASRFFFSGGLYQISRQQHNLIQQVGSFSDHCPILLRSSIIDWGPKPLKVMDWWLKDKGFQNMVAHSWGNYHPNGWGVPQTLHKTVELTERINDMEAGINASTISQTQANLKKSLQEQLWSAALAYESVLRQKSRVKWLREGDRNSSYFHRIINHRRRVNALQGLKINYAKSQFGCLGKSLDWCREPASYLNCGQLEFPFSYLGIPVGSTSKSWDAWQPLISKFESKLAKWKQRCLSTGGRIFLTALPIYLLSFFKIPKIVVHKHSNWEWQLNWRRHLFDSEIARAGSFLGDISQQQLHPLREDTWIWKPEPAGDYSTKSGYDLIWGELMEARQEQDYGAIWKLKIPTKTAMSTWRLLRDTLPTKQNLRRRQIPIDDMLCPLCRNKEEGAEHLFFNCSKTLPLWWESMSWVNLITAMPQNHRDHFLQHGMEVADGVRSKTWKCWWIALTWTIWHHRNKVVFQDTIFHGTKLLEDALFLLWSWIKAMDKDFTLHFNQWSSNLKEGLDQTYLREVAKEKKHRLLTMLECDEHDARP
ncbi:hypothetical protein HKD37_18G050765 [Glycine soja]